MLSRAVAPEGAIMPKKYIEKVGEEEFRKKPIGSGPWKFVRSVPGDRIEFEAVDYPHWRGTPHFKNLQILLVPEESTRVSMVRTGEAAIASIGPETMRSASRSGLEVLSVPGTMQALFQFWGAYRPDQKDNPVANPKVREALSLAIDRQQIIEHVMNGKASMPYPFAAFEYTEYFNADKWRKWSDQAYRYDPAQAKKLLAEAGYPNGFELKFANTALPGTPFMTDIGTAVADMWNKIGVKVNIKNYEWGSFAPLARGEQDELAGVASMYRTVGRPDMAWRYNGGFAPTSEQHLLGDKKNCGASCQEFVKVYRALLSERDPEKRTELTDQMVKTVADTWIAVPLIEGMGYYAVNPETGRAVRRHPRAGTNSATCSSASRGPTSSRGRSNAARGHCGGSRNRRSDLPAKREPTPLDGLVRGEGPGSQWCGRDETLYRLSPAARRRAALPGGDDRLLSRAADRQPGRSDAARGRHRGRPRGDDQGARARRTAVAAIPDLYRQRAARRSRHVDPHAPAGGRGVSRPAAEHARRSFRGPCCWRCSSASRSASSRR